jgi:hypothetical protein
VKWFHLRNLKLLNLEAGMVQLCSVSDHRPPDISFDLFLGHWRDFIVRSMGKDEFLFKQLLVEFLYYSRIILYY